MTQIYRYDMGGDSFKFVSCFDKEDDLFLAEDAAEDYHSNHDGWESSWPITFSLYGIDGEKIGDFAVERETVPSFVAYRKDSKW